MLAVVWNRFPSEEVEVILHKDFFVELLSKGVVLDGLRVVKHPEIRAFYRDRLNVKDTVHHNEDGKICNVTTAAGSQRELTSFLPHVCLIALECVCGRAGLYAAMPHVKSKCQMRVLASAYRQSRALGSTLHRSAKRG